MRESSVGGETLTHLTLEALGTGVQESEGERPHTQRCTDRKTEEHHETWGNRNTQENTE